MNTLTELALSAPLTRIVLFGASGLSDGLAQLALERGAEIHVICAPRQCKLMTADGAPVHERLAEMGVPVTFTEELESLRGDIEALGGDGTLAFTMGGAFQLDDGFVAPFSGRVINIHCMPLPEYRGGAGFTWPILNGDRRGAVSLLLLTDPNRDEGPLIYQRSFDFPESVRLPQDYENHTDMETGLAIAELLDGLRDGNRYPVRQQNHAESTSFPNLHTASQAFIDWSWAGAQIERFICAFSRPHPGAMTFWTRTAAMIRIFDCRFRPDPRFAHPFTSGVIFRRHGGKLFVATIDGYLEIAESDIEADAMPEEKGRLYTPAWRLDQARAFHPAYDVNGLVNPPQRPGDW